MNILVTGGAGYVGGAVADLLAKTGHTFRVYDMLLYEEDYRKDVEFIYGDVRDRERLLEQLKWADAVIWLAALVGDGACALHPDLSKEINQDSVEFLANHFGGRIVFMSTCSVYGAQPAELDETSAVAPLSVYGATKRAAEKFLLDRNAVIFRLGTLFGVGDQFARIRLDLVVNTLTVRAGRESLIKVFGGDQFRPLLHVRDAAKAAVAAIEQKPTGIFNLHRQNVRIIDLAYQVRNHFPDCKIESTDMHFQDTRNYRVRSEKAREALAFRATMSIDDGIMEVKELVQSRRLKDLDNPRYTNQGYLKALGGVI